MPDYILQPEELEHLQDLRHLSKAERETLFALARQFRILNDHQKPASLPDGIVPIRKARTR